MRFVSVLCGSLNINNLVYNNEGLTLFFNNNFIGVDFLVKFLELYKTKYSVLSFAFNVVNNTTCLVVSFSQDCVVDGLFLRRFIGGFNVFYKK